MRCYRKILHISYKDHVTNEKVGAKIQQAIGPHEDLLTSVKRRRLELYGSSSLAKTILQGTVQGGRKQGRQRKRWENNIRKTGLEFGKSQRAVENREKWRKLVAKLSVVPQQPSLLRDWWWWWWWCTPMDVHPCYEIKCSTTTNYEQRDGTQKASVVALAHSTFFFFHVFQYCLCHYFRPVLTMFSADLSFL